jgi:hypothetical protein
MNPQRFARWIGEYGKFKGWELEKGKNHKGRYVIFKLK